MSKSANLFKEAAVEVIRAKTPGLEPRYEARRLTGSEVEEAQALYGSVYSSPEDGHVGHLEEHQTEADGTPTNDPFCSISQFFGTFDQQTNELLCVERIVHKDGGTVDDLRLEVGALPAKIAQWLRAQRPGAIGEVGALAKKRGTSPLAVLKMHHALLEHAAQSPDGPDLIVFEMEPRLAPSYVQLFGDAFQPLMKEGETLSVPGFGGRYTPFLLDPRTALMQNKNTKREKSLQGIKDRLVSVCIRKYFDDVLGSPQDMEDATEIVHTRRHGYIAGGGRNKLHRGHSGRDHHTNKG